MSDTTPQNQDLSSVEQALYWIGDKLLAVKNYAEAELGAQSFVDGMNVVENYKIIYEK